MQLKSLVLLFLVSVVLCSGTESFEKSKSTLSLLDAYSAIPISTFQSYPSLGDTLSTQGSFSAQFIESSSSKLLGVGYENFYTPFPDTYRAAVLYDVSDDTLVKTDEVILDQGAGCTNGLFSPDPEFRYLAISPYYSIGAVSAYVPHSFPINIYRYHANGSIDDAPAFVYNMSDLDPINFYNKTITYTGLAGISSDGKYLVGTYSVGLPIPGAITGHKMAILKMKSDLSFDVVAKFDTAPTNIPKMYSFPQGVTMTPIKNSCKYLIMSPENSFNLTMPTGLTAQLVSYIFDSEEGTVELKDQAWISRYIQGFDIDTKNKRFYTIGSEISSNGVSVAQIPRQPYDNPSVDKDSELRAWTYTDHGTITYVGGIDLGCDGIQVRSTDDGKLLAISYAPSLIVDVYMSNVTALSPITSRYGPNSLALYSVSGGRRPKLDIQSVYSAPPLSFGLAFTKESDILAVAGQATYKQVGSSQTGQKDTALFEIL